jgi:branched-chain amino acid transport system substrate-binding protein
MRRRVVRQLGAAGLLALCPALRAAPRARAPVTVALTAEFGLRNSTSAQAIELGLRLAIGEVNAAGGILGGRPLQLITRDDRSMPSRAMRNFEEFLQVPDLLAVFGGKFSPVLLELEPLARRANVPLMAAWASADPVTGSGPERSHVFRLAPRDSWAIGVMARHLTRRRGCRTLGLLVPNTAWGRSSMEALRTLTTVTGTPYRVEWYSWGEKTLLPHYRTLRAAGMDGLIAVANEGETALLLRELAALPASQRVAVAAHSGATGGDLFGMAGAALGAVDLAIVQAFSFSGSATAQKRRVLQALSAAPGPFPVARVSSAGFAQAYDLMHLLARALGQAGSTDRTRVREALEHLPPYTGLVKTYARPFAPDRHDALSPQDVFMAGFTQDGQLVPLDER